MKHKFTLCKISHLSDFLLLIDVTEFAAKSQQIFHGIKFLLTQFFQEKKNLFQKGETIMCAALSLINGDNFDA